MTRPEAFGGKQASLLVRFPVPGDRGKVGQRVLKQEIVWRGAIAGAVALVAAAAPASAQQAGGQVTELSFTIEDRHDSNIARTDRARASQRGLALGDTRTTPAVQLTVARPLGRNTIGLTASAGYDFYRRNTRLNRERITLAANAGIAAGGCVLNLSPSYSRRQSDLADLAFLAVPGVDSVRNTETVQDYNAELRCGSSYGLRPVLTATRSTGSNSSVPRRISDYRTWSYGSGLGYTSPALGEFTALLTRTETSYPNRPAVLARSGFDTTRAQLTGKRELGGLITATWGLSYISLDPQQGGTRRFRGLGWNLAAAAVATPDLRVTAGLSRDVSPSLGTDALYVLNRTYQLGATYAVGTNLSFGVNGSVDHRRYVGATPVFGPALTNSSQRSIVGTVSASTSRRLGVGLDIGYQNRNANGTLYDFRNVFAALRAKFTL